jgi:hypothetical protein
VTCPRERGEASTANAPGADRKATCRKATCWSRRTRTGGEVSAVRTRIAHDSGSGPAGESRVSLLGASCRGVRMHNAPPGTWRRRGVNAPSRGDDRALRRAPRHPRACLVPTSVGDRDRGQLANPARSCADASVVSRRQSAPIRAEVTHGHTPARCALAVAGARLARKSWSECRHGESSP